MKSYNPIISLSVLCLTSFIFILFFNSCHTFKPIAPPHVSEAPVITVKPSFISVPVIIDMKDIESKINKEFNGLVYEDKSLEDNNHDNIMLKAWKKDNFSINLNGNVISYRMPLKLWIKTGFKLEKFGLKISDYREFNAEIAVKYKTAFTLSKDWTLVTKTSPDGYEWLSSPTVSIVGIDVPVKYLADIFLKASQGMITRRIDDTIRKGVNLRKYMDEAWTKLQQPVRVNNHYNVWLKLTPVDITAKPITGADNKLFISAAIKSVNEVIIGQEPQTANPVPLPNLNIVSSLDPVFSININTDIPFTKINDLAQRELTGKEFTEGKRKIKVMNINVYGSKDRFIVEVLVEGSIKGNVFLTGRPAYNPLTKTLEIKDLDFDISTRNKLVKAAGWLLHSNFIRTIQPKLNYSIADKLDEYSKLINQYLKSNQPVKGMTLDGKLDKMDLDVIYVTDSSLRVIIFFQGKLSVAVNGLSEL